MPQKGVIFGYLLVTFCSKNVDFPLSNATRDLPPKATKLTHLVVLGANFQSRFIGGNRRFSTILRPKYGRKSPLFRPIFGVYYGNRRIGVRKVPKNGHFSGTFWSPFARKTSISPYETRLEVCPGKLPKVGDQFGPWFKRKSLTFMILKHRFNSVRAGRSEPKPKVW